MNNSVEIVVFLLNEGEYCVEVNDVNSIVPYKNIPPKAELSAFSTIKINEKSVIFSDINKFLDLESDQITPNTRIILIESADQFFAFPVAKIKEFVTLKDVQFEETDSQIIPINKKYVSKMLKWGATYVGVLNCSNIFQNS